MLFDKRHEFIALIRIPGTSLGCRLMIFIATAFPQQRGFAYFLFFFFLLPRVCANSHEIEHFGRVQTVIVVCRPLNALELSAATIKPRVQRENENRISF